MPAKTVEELRPELKEAEDQLLLDMQKATKDYFIKVFDKILSMDMMGLPDMVFNPSAVLSEIPFFLKTKFGRDRFTIRVTLNNIPIHFWPEESEEGDDDDVRVD